MFLFSPAPARAQGNGQWITSYTITDLQTGQLLEQRNFQTNVNVNAAPVLAGTDLSVTFTIQVTTSNPSTDLTLSTNLGHSSHEGTFWALQGSYAGLNGATYNPNEQTVAFSQEVGTLTMTCYGTVPSGITQTQAGPITLDKATPFQLVVLADPSGNTLDQVQASVVDSTIAKFDTLLSQAKAEAQTLTNNGVDPAFVTLYQSVITSASDQANEGFVDNAIAILNQLASTQSSVSPVSSRTSIESILFFPAVIALAVIVVIVGFLFMRAREKVNYDKLAIEDQIKDLEGLTLRAQKIDKNISASLESVKERLKSLVGEQ